jgi:hypothetical protein
MAMADPHIIRGRHDSVILGAEGPEEAHTSYRPWDDLQVPPESLTDEQLEDRMRFCYQEGTMATKRLEEIRSIIYQEGAMATKRLEEIRSIIQPLIDEESKIYQNPRFYREQFANLATEMMRRTALKEKGDG